MNELNDYELLEYISSNEEAYNLLFEKYKPLIISLAQKYYPSCKNAGYELNDLIQEGMIGLNNSIEYFDINKNIKFYTLARICIERQMLTLIATTKKKKNKILNESLSYEFDDVDLLNQLGDYKSDPLNLIVNNDEKEIIINKIYSKLSKEEKNVFDYKSKGFKNTEIAEILNKTDKQINNTITRIKNKINEERKKEKI